MPELPSTKPIGVTKTERPIPVPGSCRGNTEADPLLFIRCRWVGTPRSATLSIPSSERFVAAFVTGRALPDAVYYRLAGVNYRYRIVATEKRVRHGSFPSYELYNRHGNDWLLAALLDRCRDGDCVIDVGATTGVYSLSVATESPDATVVAIEPNPRTMDTLRANAAESGLSPLSPFTGAVGKYLSRPSSCKFTRG